MWLGDNIIVTDAVYLRTDRLGGRYWTHEPGPLMIALVPCLFAVFAYCAFTVWQSRSIAPGERRAVLASFAVYVACAVNDVLHAARVIESVRLFDYAFISGHSHAQFSHSICPDCRDGVVKDELDRWRHA